MNLFHKKVNSALSKKPGNQALANKFLSGDTPFKRYVIGKNEQSIELINQFQVDGIIDDYNQKKSHWKSIPVISTNSLPESAIVVNCSTSITPITVDRKLREVGVRNVISHHELVFACGCLLNLPGFVKQMQTDYQENYEEWSYLHDLMADDISRKTLIDVLRYRLTADPYYMKDYSVKPNEQYFEDFMNYKHEVFADIGGFDGDTTEEFCKRFQDYQKVLFFEPSETNIAAAKVRLKNLRNIEYYPVGLSDKEETLSFNSSNGSASSISIKGDSKINVFRFDTLVKQPVSVIKMDIEGWEMKALEGSKNLIKSQKPKLAIAVYHKAADFRTIPSLLRELNPEYQIYLRHYTEGWSETVMFFVP